MGVVEICLHLVLILAYNCKYFVTFSCLLGMDKILFDQTKKVEGFRTTLMDSIVYC